MTFSASTYALVRRIPKGRIASYGGVAAMLGRPRAARGVGTALSALPFDTDVPWWRVVNVRGGISAPRWDGRGLRQRDLLEREGVEFDAMGRVSSPRFWWDPGETGSETPAASREVGRGRQDLRDAGIADAGEAGRVRRGSHGALGSARDVGLAETPAGGAARGRCAARAMTLAVAAAASACAAPPPDPWGAYAEIVREEDARGALGLDRVLAHLHSDDPDVRRFAVRALGRLEDPAQLDRIAGLLEDPDDVVRQEAASAAAQAVHRGGASAAAEALAAQAAREDDPHVLGSLAANLGRLRGLDEAGRSVVEDGLAGIAVRLPELEEDVGLAARLGLARGVAALVRAGPDRTPAAPLLEAMHGLRSLRVPADARTAARIRRLATTVVAVAAAQWRDGRAAAQGGAGAEQGAVPPSGAGAGQEAGPPGGADRGAGDGGRGPEPLATFLEGGALAALSDEDWGVRRIVARAAAESGLGGRELIFAALADEDARVRTEALRAYERRVRPNEGCAALLEAAADADWRVALAAVDLLAEPCPELAEQADMLADLAAPLMRTAPGAGTDDGGEWRLPARALASLAAVAPARAADAIAANRDHPSPFARAWIAHAAARSGDAETLAALSADADPNVREAALRGLGAVSGEAAFAVYAGQLRAADPQLVMTAVDLLGRHGGRADSASRDSVLADLLAALRDFTALERETQRDVRTALLEGVQRLGGYAAADLEPWLADFDPVVADRAADAIGALGGPRPEPTPRPLPLASPPGAERLRELARSSVRLRMEELGDVVIALRPDLAATNADRFARLATEGWFDGLTFHRVVPNFVIQGGSPHANEYAGAGPYSRDEISSQPHWRGAVGLSTRGRDTGDAQIFVNLVDNLRLDFDYTILGEVVEGMDVVDRVQEGSVILEARVEPR